jgi:hypothetical protein
MANGVSPWLMNSARFLGDAAEQTSREINTHLRDLGTTTFMVDVGVGETFAEPTDVGLYGCKALLVHGTANYGAKTTAPYCSYYELQIARNTGKPIIAIQMCDTWPPAPRDHDGGYAGAAQNESFLLNCLLRIDGRGKTTAQIAQKVKEAYDRL